MLHEKIKPYHISLSRNYLSSNTNWEEILNDANSCLSAVDADPNSIETGWVEHIAYTFFGLYHLHFNDVDKAVGDLHKSIDVRPSPVLKSFGPSMCLAQQLLEVDRFDDVQGYLKRCKQTWLFPFSFFKLRRWMKKVGNREVPDFGPQEMTHVLVP